MRLAAGRGFETLTAGLRPAFPAAPLNNLGRNRCVSFGYLQGAQAVDRRDEILRLRREEKLGPAAIARRLGIGRASVYRLLGKQAAKGGVDADQG